MTDHAASTTSASFGLTDEGGLELDGGEFAKGGRRPGRLHLQRPARSDRRKEFIIQTGLKAVAEFERRHGAFTAEHAVVGSSAMSGDLGL